VLAISGLAKSFDGVRAVDGFSVQVKAGTIVGLIGPNGAGKTTAFHLITGFLEPDAGEVQFEGRVLKGLAPHRISRLGVARTFQNLRLISRLPVLDNLLLAFPGQAGEGVGGALLARRFRRQETRNHESASALLESVGIADKAAELAGEVSYGQQKLLSLTCCLATGARLLLLDEPVAGVAPQLVEQIVGMLLRLRGEGKTIVVIEHNLRAIAALCDNVVVMDEGRKIAEGAPQTVLADERVAEAYLR